MAQSYVKAFFDWVEQMSALEDDEKGRLFVAILEYARSGEIVEMKGRESLLFPVFKTQIDRENKLSEKQSENGKKGGRPKTQTNPKKANQSQKKPTKANKEEEKEEDEDEDKEKEKEEDEREDSAEPETVSPPVISLPLNDGTFFAVSSEQCQEWAGLYPAVDVIQQLRGMLGWLDANPSKWKTPRGIRPFIVRWLAKEQDRGGCRSSPRAGIPAQKPQRQSWAELARQMDAEEGSA
ncbi:DUF6291 domain-containing protein [Paratractidigestivibacter sp.]|uniref:DUF6291 domain-containing protein n=1 Tax=Paratractidigestivibacter sp. TaxID=2847316 RepID=UPI002ACB13F6|nr:DUF6291 domain-containing protein [Paratractidigestivibacter sp.]